MSLDWISAGPAAYISIDSYLRLYISSGACTVLNVPENGEFRLVAGFDHANKRIVLAKPEIVRVPNVQPFKFDKRRYGHAKRIVAKAGFAEADLPLRFAYVGIDYAEYPDGAFAFQLETHEAPDK
ncbi:hypothetical protein [Bacillus chungangensis]|uniref:Uncharacterized protein n=1 Tax=Bacillus chungangensis TaxID=587633 RepID=A0ABT9WME6_9BACI|nr:hypothetical protein [Bacillus chungangensis]MDQ0174402.1 hypothetical protein [Bacillus chungangensis]